MSNEEILKLRLETLSKMSIEERLKTIESVLIFLLKENGVFVDEEIGDVYFQSYRCGRQDEDTFIALQLMADII